MSHHDDREDRDEEWTGSFKRPWMNPPMRSDLGTSRGSWKYAMIGIALVIVVTIVVLVLVDQDVISRWWAYVVIPLAIIGAAASRVLTILKAKAETTHRDAE